MAEKDQAEKGQAEKDQGASSSKALVAVAKERLLSEVPSKPPKVKSSRALDTRPRGSPPDYLQRAIADAQQKEAHALTVIDRAKRNQKEVEALVRKKDTQVAARVFRTNIYTAVLTVIAIVGGIDHNVVGTAVAGIFAAGLRAETAARSYRWHKVKDRIRAMMDVSSERLATWLKHRDSLVTVRQRMQERR